MLIFSTGFLHIIQDQISFLQGHGNFTGLYDNLFLIKQFHKYIEYVATGMEITGILIISAGTLYILLNHLFQRKKSSAFRNAKNLRHELGRTLLLGLEILVAGDIIATVVIDAKMQTVLTLGLIVLIRTFLSLSIEVEIEGRFPWNRNN